MKKKILKFLIYIPIYIILLFVLIVLVILPLQAILLLGRLLGSLLYFFASKHRKVAYESLKIAFGDSIDDPKKIIKNEFSMMGEQLLETLFYAVRKQDSKAKIRVVGEENLLAAHKKGKGIICVTAHMGNFPITMCAVKRYGINSNIMLRPLRNKIFSTVVSKLMENIKIWPIFSYPRKKAIFQSLKALNRNECLLMLMDQNFGTGGVWVDFFGKLAATPTGPVVMAQRSGAALVPIYIQRDKAGYHTLYIEEEFKLIEAQDPDEATLLNVAAITKIIESWIVKHPESWSWIHKRWKSRPSELVLSQKFKVQRI